MNIVISNDDGIEAKGIYRLWRAANEMSKSIVISAPMSDQSSKGFSMTTPINKSIATSRISWEGNTQAWAVSGTPVDAAKFGLSKSQPDLFLSGINSGHNTGNTVLQSGTVAAATYAACFNIPAIAFSKSKNNNDPENLDIAIIEILKYFQSYPIKNGIVMNINFPDRKIIGFKMTRKGNSFWDPYIQQTSGDSHPISDMWKIEKESHDSDVLLIEHGYITCTPLNVGNLTDLSIFEEQQNSFTELNQRLT